MSRKTFEFDLRPNKLLLDPSFEGYKLSLDRIPIYRKSLPSGVHRVRPADHQFSYNHVKHFSLHNHIHVNHKNQRALYYVDERYRVHKIIFSSWSHEIILEEVFDFSQLYTHKTGDYNVSIAFPSVNLVVLCPGNGTLYLIKTFESEGREKWQLITSDSLIKEEKPCTIISAEIEKGNDDSLLHVILLEIQEKESNENDKSKKSLFETLVKWRCFINSEEESWKHKCFKSFSVNGNIDYFSLEKNYQCAHIICDKHPKWIEDTENSIVVQNDVKKDAKNDAENKPKPLYLWTQTDKELTVWLQITEEVTKKDIEISFSDLNMEIKVKNERLIGGNFFHRIDSDLSVWCLEKNKLEVQLFKHETGLMWKLLLVDDDKGEEIIDLSVVEAVHEQLSHLCSDQDDSHLPPFNSQQLEECDAPSCDSTVLLRLDSLHHEVTHEVNLSGSQWLFNVNCEPDQPPAICCRHDVDACVWQFKDNQEDDKSWPHEHLGTFNAFGYVQASKTQKKFLVSSPNLSYVAICETSHRVFIYRQPTILSSELKNRNTGKKVKTISKQQLINLETNEEILGVYATDVNLFVLLENSICVLVVND